MDKTPAKTTAAKGDAPKAATKTSTISPAYDETGKRTEPGEMARRGDAALQQPDPNAKPVEQVTTTAAKDSTKEQFAAADAVAARAVSGL